MEKVKMTLEQLESCFEYLEELRQSGDTNMFGASPYVEEEFDFTKQLAGKVLSAWMKNYNREDASAGAAAAFKEWND